MDKDIVSVNVDWREVTTVRQPTVYFDRASTLQR